MGKKKLTEDDVENSDVDEPDSPPSTGMSTLPPSVL